MAVEVSLRPEVARASGQQAQPLTPVKLAASQLNFFYGAKQALTDINVELRTNVVTAFIGPSGCGKSTFLRTLNRMNDIIPGTRVEGSVAIDGRDIYASGTDVVALRRQVGMVFQKSNPFPKSIFENVAYGLRINGLAKGRRDLEERVEASLTDAALWDEVKDRLHDSALALSGGQQQRLCIARALAIRPDVLLMDEPASAPGPDRDAADRGAHLRLEAQLHDRDRHAQHAAGGPGLGLHRLLLVGQAGRIRTDRADLHESGRETDRRLRDRAIRLRPGPAARGTRPRS